MIFFFPSWKQTSLFLGSTSLSVKQHTSAASEEETDAESNDGLLFQPTENCCDAPQMFSFTFLANKIKAAMGEADAEPDLNRWMRAGCCGLCLNGL